MAMRLLSEIDWAAWVPRQRATLLFVVRFIEGAAWNTPPPCFLRPGSGILLARGVEIRNRGKGMISRGVRPERAKAGP